MADFPTPIRMPGSSSVFAEVDEFAPGEIAGMRSAGIVLLANVVLAGGMWLLTRDGLPITMAVDAFLGIQIFRLRHSWRAWAMLRAGVGAMLGALIVLGSPAAPEHAVAVGIVGVGQIVYCVSLLLLLFSTPTPARVKAGRAFAVLALTMNVGVNVWAATTTRVSAEPETDVRIDVRPPA